MKRFKAAWERFAADEANLTEFEHPIGGRLTSPR
jgi:hypothetical protein